MVQCYGTRTGQSDYFFWQDSLFKFVIKCHTAVIHSANSLPMYSTLCRKSFKALSVATETHNITKRRQNLWTLKTRRRDQRTSAKEFCLAMVKTVTRAIKLRLFGRCLHIFYWLLQGRIWKLYRCFVLYHFLQIHFLLRRRWYCAKGFPLIKNLPSFVLRVTHTCLSDI